MQKEVILLRQETPADYRAVEELTREAFWNHHVPGCDEHYLVHVMRSDAAFVPQLDYVALKDGKIVGNIMYTKCRIACDDGRKKEVLCFGPVSVLPQYQGQGIGSLLIDHTKELARELGYDAILIYGDPDYYRRVQFVPAQTFGIATADNMYADALLALELIPGALQNCAGRFEEASVYTLDAEKSKVFNQTFTSKPMLEGLPTQERFSYLVGRRTPRTPLQ